MKPNTLDAPTKARGAFNPYWRKLAFSLLLASLFLSTSKPCNANPSSTTNKPLIVANTAHELQSLIQDAENGDPIAQYLIGIHYWHEEDFKQGILWLEKAASNRNVYAQSKLAGAYRYEFQIDENPEKSIKYTLLAADQGSARNQIEIGNNYCNGENGFPVNYQKAIEYYLLAEKQGSSWAQRLLGYMYREGKGVPVDQEKSAFWYGKEKRTDAENKQRSIDEYDSHPLIIFAKNGNHMSEYLVGFHFSFQEVFFEELGNKWMNQSAEAGNMYAQYEMGNHYSDTLNSGHKDIQKALQYYDFSAKQNYAPAQCCLGRLYAKGGDIPFSQKKGIFWYEKAALNGSELAQYILASSYYDGGETFWPKCPLPKNLAKSFKYYRMLAEQEDAWAQYMVGSMYTDGEGVRKDFKQGIFWFEKAAENGEDLAQSELGICYYLGNKDVAKDYKKAFNYSLLAAKQNHAQAQYTVGFMYMRGQGVIEDYKAGIEWLKKSAFQENENAQYELGLCYYQGTGVLQDYTEAYAWSLLSVMNGGEDTVKSVLQNELSTQQIMTAQDRAKELLKEIESTKTPEI